MVVNLKNGLNEVHRKHRALGLLSKLSGLEVFFYNLRLPLTKDRAWKGCCVGGRTN